MPSRAPAGRGQVTVTGYKDLLKGLKTADKETRAAVRATLKTVGEATRASAIHKLSPIDKRSAAGYKTRVRQRGVGVEQSLKRTTGKHPEWGAYQMRHALIPALEDNEAETMRRMEAALDDVAAQFNRGNTG